MYQTIVIAQLIARVNLNILMEFNLHLKQVNCRTAHNMILLKYISFGWVGSLYSYAHIFNFTLFLVCLWRENKIGIVSTILHFKYFLTYSKSFLNRKSGNPMIFT